MLMSGTWNRFQNSCTIYQGRDQPDVKRSREVPAGG
jgi:hypothetical protein